MTSPHAPMSTVPPVADWVSPQDLRVDPYPIYERLRRETPVAWVPSVGRYMVTTYDGCFAVELDREAFSANITGAGTTMVRTMGTAPMIAKDDPEHAVERSTINPMLRPKSIKGQWADTFAANARTYLDRLSLAGPEVADLNHDYAAPIAAQNLIDLLGLPDVEADQMQRWSNALIAGISNLADDADVWAAATTAGAEVDAILAELIGHVRAHPNESMTSALVNGGLPAENVAANVKLTISGGMNEPQHMVTNMVWALELHPDQRRRVFEDPALWPTVFDETLRWMSPIGMYLRGTTRPVELCGVMLPAGAPVGVVVGSANRDEAHFDGDPALFDIFRAKKPHLGFGTGVHLCAGHWAAKTAIGQLAVPMLYERFPTLRIDERRPTRWDGWTFRGLTSLPVTWDD